MHRIDGPAILPGGFFSEGDPMTGAPATVLTADWANAIQEETAGVVEGAGLVLNKADNGQLLAAIQALVRQRAPVGEVLQGYFTTAPAGTLLCDGSLVSRVAFPDLWLHATAQGLTVSEATWSASSWTLFSVGDGATTFRLPDLRGEHVRGADFGRGVNPGRAVGTWQADQLRAHKHVGGYGEAAAGPFGNTATSVYQGSNANDFDNALFSTNDGTEFDGAPGNPPGIIGAETRPRSVALAFCVRF